MCRRLQARGLVSLAFTLIPLRRRRLPYNENSRVATHGGSRARSRTVRSPTTTVVCSLPPPYSDRYLRNSTNPETRRHRLTAKWHYCVQRAPYRACVPPGTPETSPVPTHRLELLRPTFPEERIYSKKAPPLQLLHIRRLPYLCLTLGSTF